MESPLEPEEIRAIRERLGLTQMEAGELLGGGPRAFTKYEAGIVKPAAAVNSLLRLLDADPGAIETLREGRSRATPVARPLPFEVTGQHVAALTERNFPELLRLLLSAEAFAHGLPADGVHVSSTIHAPDSGEDGRIEWQHGPERTPFLPSRLCQFQLKAGKISPAKAGRDVLTKTGAVKDLVRSALSDGGHYIMLCTHPYTQKQLGIRKAEIRTALRSTGITLGDDQVDFRDADQIADWVNRHPSVASWVIERVQPGLLGPFRSWSHWASRAEHDGSPWVEDERLAGLCAFLREEIRITNQRSTARLVGLAGIGKSRLLLEALGPSEESGAVGRPLSDIVLYTDESETGSGAIKTAVQNMADSGARAVVVVDCCAPETHRTLAGMVLRQSSQLSLVTIDNEIPAGTLDKTTTFKVDEAPFPVTEAIINRLSPELPSEDQRRLARFSRGFPKVAILIGQAWAESTPLAHAIDDDLVDAFVLGRSPREREVLLKSAALLAAFGLVGVERPLDSQLREIASLGRGLTADDLHATIKELASRGVAQRRGRYVVLQPRPIAMKLAERQWREWSQGTWDRVLTSDTRLKVLAARQLSLLNRTDIAEDVVKQICRFNGPFDGFKGLSKSGHAKVLSSLAEIDAQVVVDQIERSLSEVEDLSAVEGAVRRHTVWALEKIAFHTDTFEDGARLLLRLAVAENETWANNATGQFAALFPMLLGNTAADGKARLSVLDDAADTDDANQRVVVAKALLAGAKTRHFSRTAGAETHGSRPALESWRPATNEEATDYIKGCVTRLAQFLPRDDEAGVTTRAELGSTLRLLVLDGFIDTVETVVHQVVNAGAGSWPQALRSLGDVLDYDADSVDSELLDRVRALIEELQPKSLESRVRSLVTERSWTHVGSKRLDSKAQYQHRVGAVRELATELLGQPETLAETLPKLSRGQQVMTHDFGLAVATVADSPVEWLEPIVQSVLEAPEAERNFDLLSGFLLGLAKKHPHEVTEFKRRATQSRELAPAFPPICLRLGIDASDIQLAVDALEAGLLHPWRLNSWSLGGVLAEVPAPVVAPLFDTMLDYSAEAFTVAVELMGMYAHGAPEKLNGLRPQVRKLAESVIRWKQALGQRPQGPQMDDHHFAQIMDWMLSNGRQDPDASATALSLAKALVNVERFNDDRLLKPVIPRLLSSFPEVAWPLIGQAIASDKRRAWLLELVLGDPHALGRETKPVILSLPEDSLFAWCHAQPDYAPAFAASVVPVLTTQQVDAPERALHPVMVRLLDEFGDRKDVQQAVDRNMHSFSWSGSRTSYYALYKEPMSRLLRHRKPEVRRWAKAVLRQLDAAIECARNEDEEMAAEDEA